jgi:hypothetical protein
MNGKMPNILNSASQLKIMVSMATYWHEHGASNKEKYALNGGWNHLLLKLIFLGLKMVIRPKHVAVIEIKY